MKLSHALTVGVVCAGLALGSCATSDQTEEKTTAAATVLPSQSSPHPQLLGELTPQDSTGHQHCDPSVVALDHDQFTATVRYFGTPGLNTEEGKAEFQAIGADGSVLGTFGFGLAAQGNLTLGTAIPNPDIDHVAVTATAPGVEEVRCVITMR